MLTIDDYLDRARTRGKDTSDRALARRLGLAAQTVNHWRTKRSWPSDDVMVQLSEMAGIDPIDGLIDLSQWRTDGPARSIYAAIRERLAHVAAALLALVLVGAISRPAEAAPASPSVSITIHYAIVLARLWRAFARQIKGLFIPPLTT